MASSRGYAVRASASLMTTTGWLPAGIPYVVPDAEHVAERLDAVLAVIYLVFTEGYAATSGDEVIRTSLCSEAIRLGRLLVELLPDPEANGLLALMLLHDARRDARASPGGEVRLLEEQDRSQWDRGQIAEGLERVERSFRAGRVGPYALQAAIAALHVEAPAAETDWRQIVALYEVLLRIQPSAVVALNHGVAVAMAQGPAAGLAILDGLADRKELSGYHLLPAARADLLARLGRNTESASAYRTALALATLAPERRFLEGRLVVVTERRLAESDPNQ